MEWDGHPLFNTLETDGGKVGKSPKIRGFSQLSFTNLFAKISVSVLQFTRLYGIIFI